MQFTNQGDENLYTLLQTKQFDAMIDLENLNSGNFLLFLLVFLPDIVMVLLLWHDFYLTLRSVFAFGRRYSDVFRGVWDFMRCFFALFALYLLRFAFRIRSKGGFCGFFTLFVLDLVCAFCFLSVFFDCIWQKNNEIWKIKWGRNEIFSFNAQGRTLPCPIVSKMARRDLKIFSKMVNIGPS